MGDGGEAHAHGAVVGRDLDLGGEGSGGEGKGGGGGDRSTARGRPIGTSGEGGGGEGLGAAHVRAAQGEGRVGAHHERRHRVVRVLVADGESRARRRKSRVYRDIEEPTRFYLFWEKIFEKSRSSVAMGRPETAPLCTNGKPRKTVQESSRVVTRRHSELATDRVIAP